MQMPLDIKRGESTPEELARISALNHRYRHHAAFQVLEDALKDPEVGKIALVSSFGAESVVLLHMVSVINPATPVLFIDTEMLFAETLAYQSEVAEKLGLTDVRRIHPAHADLLREDPEGYLHLADPDTCCDLRKTKPLERALNDFDGWITGRKRFQGATRAALDFFEEDGAGRIKVNPLAHWTKDDVREYMLNNRLPKHPLVAQGYPSIGCLPCTTPVKPGEDERAGRWRGTGKVECGIHIADGQIVREGAAA